MKHSTEHDQGFVLMIATLLIIVLAVVIFAFLHVRGAHR